MRRIPALVMFALGGVSAHLVACGGEDSPSATNTGAQAGAAANGAGASASAGVATSDGTAGQSVAAQAGTASQDGLPAAGQGSDPQDPNPSAGTASAAAGAAGQGAQNDVAGGSSDAVAGAAVVDDGATDPAGSGNTDVLAGAPAAGADDGSDTTPDNMAGESAVDVDVPDVDANGKSNAVPGESTSEAQDYLRLGEIRLLNNNWGSAERGCDTGMSVFVQADSTFGWDFNRGACGGGGSQPDFPQIEFGIHPFGIGSELVTSPEFSSTTLLPAQIKDISSASVAVENLNISLQTGQAWNITMEFWLSERNPLEPNPGVYAEVMAFWGWQNKRWPCDSNEDGFEDYDGDSVQAGSMSYKLCHQRDDWADNQWRYFQFRAGDGTDANIKTSFNGTIDVKAFLDYVVNSRGYSPELWVTRMEVGSEIDDNTGGRVTLSGITFEVNGERRSQVIGVP